MNRNLTLTCSDINSPFCPCLLAETNNCICCSQLSGGELCSCNWKGVCILYEKRWKSRGDAGLGEGKIVVRSEFESSFFSQKALSDNVYLLQFDVPPEMAVELKKTGSFVFLRRRGDPHYCHFPVGVMKVDENQIQVIVEAVGPKSKRFLDNSDDKVMVRGPYYNGVLGQPWIDNVSCGTILLVAGGMGQPPAIPIAEKLRSNSNEVIAIVAPGKIDKVLIEEELLGMDVEVNIVSSMRREGLAILDQLIRTEKIDLVVSAGPDEQHYGVIGAMRAAGVNLPLAVTNNATMCCGEGICGSCECETLNNKKLRICKAQTDYINLNISN